MDAVSTATENSLGGAAQIPDAAVSRLALQPLGGVVP